MIEKLKSVILVLLVGTSLLLTYQLWYGQQPAELDADEVIYERIVIEQPRPPEQIVFPATISIKAGSSFYIFREGEPLYYNLWDQILRLMNSAYKSGVPEIATDFYDGSPPLLSCYLNPLLPVGSEHSLFPLLPEGELSRLDLIGGNEGYRIRLLKADGEVISEAEFAAGRVATLIDLISNAREEERVGHLLLDGVTVNSLSGDNIILSGTFFLPQEEMIMARFPVKAEAIDREQLLKTFFVDSSLARTIEEKNGAVIYTDGDKGLRLTAAGFEYSHPRLEEGEASQTIAEALNNSGAYISIHGGWPVGLRLERIEHSRLGRSATYSAQWRMYFRGYPIYTAKPTRIIFNDRGLIHLNRLIYNIQAVDQDQVEARVAAPWQEALKKALTIYLEQSGEPPADLTLEAFNLGFAIVAAVNEIWAEPVWHLQINGHRILLRADTLLPIKTEDLR